MSLSSSRVGIARVLRAGVCCAPLLLAACAAFPSMTTGAPVSPDPRVDEPLQIGPGAEAARPTQRSSSLAIPGPSRPTDGRLPATTEQIAALLPDEPVDAALAPQTIPQFVATVFGGVLGVPYALSSDVATRGEIISGGTGGQIGKRELFRLTQQALRQYGIDVFIDGGAVTVGRGSPGGPIDAEVIRGRGAPEGGARVVQFFTVQTIEVNALQSLMQDLFPNLGGARITPDQLTNSLIISGPAREVARVVQAVREIDQPRFAGAEVIRIEPVYWSAEGLATSLEQVLTTEGYVVSRTPLAGRAAVILAFPTANQILVFVRDPDLMARVRFWSTTLDQPAALGDAATTFVYQVNNTDAQSLGQLAMGQSPSNLAQTRAPVGVPGGIADNGGFGGGRNGGGQGLGQGAPQGASGQFLNGRLLTDPIGNRILFTGTATEYAQLRTLLNTLDVPAPQVVIEVMIAEVTLTDSTRIGVSLFGTEVRGDGVSTASTEGLSIGGGALAYTFVGPDFRARLVANASNNRINILQSPRLVTRSGVAARFQVGTDVPIITSQRATDFQSGDGISDVLQSVQYRQTGTILDITPVIYGDRVDISISQELSSAGEPPNAAIASPTILNRSLTTQIAISDGYTGVLGGLVSNNYSKVNTGVPFLKDIPIVGSAFQTNAVSGDRTELLLLITPRIIRGDEDMTDYVAQYSADMNAAFRTGRGWSYTLTPFSVGRGFRGVGFDLPSAEPASERPAVLPDFVRPSTYRRPPPVEAGAPVELEEDSVRAPVPAAELPVASAPATDTDAVVTPVDPDQAPAPARAPPPGPVAAPPPANRPQTPAPGEG